MGSAFESSRVVSKLDISLFMPLAGQTGRSDIFSGHNFESILQETITQSSQRNDRPDSTQNRSRDFQAERVQQSKIRESRVKGDIRNERQRERTERSEQHQSTQSQRNEDSNEQQDNEYNDTNRQNAEENYAGQDSSQKDNSDENNKVDQKNDGEPTRSESGEDKNSNKDGELQEIPADIIISDSDIFETVGQDQPVEISEVDTGKVIQEVTQAGEKESLFAELIVSDKITVPVGAAESVTEPESVVVPESADKESLPDQTGEAIAKSEITLPAQDVDFDESGMEPALQDQKTQEKTTGSTATQDTQADQNAVLYDARQEKTVGQTDESKDADPAMLDQSEEVGDENIDDAILNQFSDAKMARQHQQSQNDHNQRQEKSPADSQPAMAENTLQQQQPQSDGLHTEQLKDINIQQVVEGKSEMSGEMQNSSDAEVKKGIDIISGASQPKLKDSVESAQAKQDAGAARSMDYKTEEQEIVRQVQAKLSLRSMGDINQSEIKFNLYPKHLGEVAMKLVMHDNTLVARMRVDNESVKQALEANIGELRRNLMNQGVKVEKIEVTVKSDTQTMGSFDERRASGHAEQKNNYEYVTAGSHRFKDETDDAGEQPAKRMSYNKQQAVTVDGRLNYLA